MEINILLTHRKLKKQKITREIRKYPETNENRNTTLKHTNATKTMQSGKFTTKCLH